MSNQAGQNKQEKGAISHQTEIGDQQIDQRTQSGSPITKGTENQQEEVDMDTVAENDASAEPATMDIRVVMKMLRDLKTEIKKDFTAELAPIKKIIEKPVQAELPPKEMDRLNTLEKKVQVCEFKEQIMIETMDYMMSVIKEQQQKLDTIDSNNAKRMIILSNFEVDYEDKVTSRRQLDDFLNGEMEANVEIDDFYYIGQSKEIVIILQTVQQKKLIFKNIDKIKNYVNAHGKKYRFRDFKTTKQIEVSKRSQQIADACMEIEEVDREDVVVQGNSIYIGETRFEEKVEPPEATSVLSLSLQQLNHIMNIQLQKGEAIHKEGNTFIGYSICVKTTQQIKDVYMQLRLNHANARHIVCAWHIPSARKYEEWGHCDDQDYGSSTEIMKMMQQNGIENRVVFVVRKCGMKLNAERYQMYKEAAKEVINKFPENEICKSQQNIAAENWATEPYRALRGQVYRRGQNRARGRGVRGLQYKQQNRGGRGTYYKYPMRLR